MVVDPRTEDEIGTNLQDFLSGRIDKLTNFVPGSFNQTWVEAYSDQIHEIEAKALAAQLSGWVEYSGGPVTEEDLDDLGVDGVTPDEVNEYMEDQHLDELAKIVGVNRDPGQRATGQVTVQTATDSTRVPEGMEVSTAGGVGEEQLVFLVDADGDGEIEDDGFVTPSSGQTEVTVDVLAEEVGTDYNVGPNTIKQLPNPPIGVEGVTNTSSTTGGEDEQDNSSLREDVQNAVFETSGGGTVLGIEGFVEDDVEGVSDVALDEFKDEQPPFVDVVVDGGVRSEVEDAIDESRPAGIRHNLVRPETISVAVRAQLSGMDIDVSGVESKIDDYFLELSIGDDFSRSQLVQAIMNSDADIDGLTNLASFIDEVTGETHIYQSGTNIYELDETPIGDVDDDQFVYQSGTDVYDLWFDGLDDSSVEVVGIVDNEEYDFVNDTDYDVIDDNTDSNLDSIDFSIGGESPDDGTIVTVEYDHADWSISSTITDKDGNTYDEGTDWSLVDNDGDGNMDSVDWSIGGSSPADGVGWSVDYEPGRSISANLSQSIREKVTTSDETVVSVL